MYYLSSLPVSKSGGGTTENSVVVRTSSVEIESGYFDSVENFNEDNIIRIVARKKISGDALSGYETASLKDDYYSVSYDIVTDLNESDITLNVYFDNTKEIILENFTGVPMTNYNDEKDIMFSVDNYHVFLSELTSFTGEEQCSYFGNFLHKTLNAGMMALAYIEPAVKILAETGEAVIGALYSSVKKAKYQNNYSINSALDQPEGYVYRQDKYSEWNYDFSNLSWAGCGVIAGYNMAHALGKDYTLAQVTLLYEMLGIEVNLAQGFLGSNPYQISYFLDSAGIEYTKITNYRKFESYMENESDYYIIISEWNGEECESSAHIFMVDKDNDYTLKYHAYNYKSRDNTYDRNKYSDLFNCSVYNSFMCAYFITK